MLALLTAPIQNVVSRRYEAEADWRALNATRDPASARKLFAELRADEPRGSEPAALDYLWLENHPTLMQRIAMTRALAALASGVGPVVRLGQVLDALDRRVLRVGVLHRGEQLPHELLRHVHA